MSTDPSAITTEIPVTALPAGVVAQPGPDTGPGPAAAGQSAGGREPCPHCGSPLALDQRYCLECGAPRTYLSGMLLERMRSPTGQAGPIDSPAAGVAGGSFGTLPPTAGSPGSGRGNALTLVAGVGVLLLAMGVGVLIGRSGGQSSAASPAPQVITVGGTAGGAASTATTPSTTAPAETPAAKSGATPPAAAKHKAKAEEPSGAGSSPSKPAPSTVLKNLHSGSQQEREQKSKNLPNVVSTG